MDLKSLLFFLTVFIASWNNNFYAQKDSTDRLGKLQGFPVAFYTPETSLAFGGLGNYSFDWTGNPTLNKRSSVILGGVYTLNKQLLLYFPYNLFLRNDKHRLIGELGYFDYQYFYFGIGEQSRSFDEKKENYFVDFYRFRMNALRRLSPKFFLGLRLSVDKFNSISFPENSSITQQNLLGVEGGTTAGNGLALLYDTRDSVYYPRKGILIESNFTQDYGLLLSDFVYARYVVDYAQYQSVGNRSVLAWNVNFQAVNGEAPFYALPVLGGGRRLRGQFEGEWRDKQVLQTQVEFRQEFLKNWGWVAFAGVGWIGGENNRLLNDKMKEGGGLGLRYKLNKRDHINVRLDIGFSRGQILPYITIGEAF